MRNLKRALSLGLASSMVLGTMAFSASAATSTSVTPTEVQTSFNDNDTISPENVNSIYIAAQIGLTEGKDGNVFDPEGTVTRMEMAIICVNMKYGVDYATANFSEGGSATSPFGDVTWGHEFATVAAQDGIIYGVGEDANGQMMFNPDGKVIAADALLMIMKTLGYFKNPTKEFSVDYKYASGAQATELNLYDENEYGLTEELSREEVFAVAVRALTTCARVNYNYETGNYYNESAGYNSALLPNNNIVEDTLGYQKFSLKAVDSVDSFNRPTTLWTINSKEIANFVVDEHLDSNGEAMVFTTAKTYQEIAKELSTVTKESNEDYYDYGVFVDGMEYGEWMLANDYSAEEEIIATTTTLEGFNSVISTKNTGHFVPSNNGVLTQVFVEEPVSYFDTQGNWIIEKGKVYVTCINTFLAEVRSTYDYGNGEFGTTIRYYKNYLKDSNKEKEGVEYDAAFDVDVITTQEYTVGDIVMVQVSAKDAQAAAGGGYSDDDVDIIHINYPETVTGSVTEVKLSVESVGGMYFDIDETRYDYSVAMRGDLNEMNETMAPSPDAEIIAYFDDNVQENEQGYVLGYKVVEQTPKYLYVEECDGDGFSFYDGSTARVTFADGEEKIIQISHIDGEQVGWDNYTTIPTGSRFKTESGAWIAPNENFVVETAADGTVTINTDEIENRIFGYEETVDAQGNPSYNIITTIQKDYTIDDGANKGGLLAMTTNKRLDAYDASKTIGYNHLSYGTLDFNATTGLNDDGDPVKDTMAIFTSVYMPSTLSEFDRYTSNYGSDDIDGGYVKYDSVVANPNNVASYTDDGEDVEPNSYYNFALYSGEIASFVMETESEGTRTFFDKDDDVIAQGDIITSDLSDAKHDHLFLIDENTVFIDVVSSGAVALNYNEIDDMTNGDLNMQVIFGEGGYADTVFISYGIPTEDIGATDYVIFKDAKATAKTEDGITYYYYDVWIEGEEKVIRSRSNEVVVTNGVLKDDEAGKPLQTNTLYKISKFDSMNDLVIEVEYEYDYSPLFTARYNSDDAKNYGTVATNDFNEIYNNLWSVATSVTGSTNSYTSGSLKLAYDDDYADPSETVDGLMDGNTMDGADLFSYNEDTVFMVIDVTTDGKLKTVSRGDAGDIITYRDDDDHYVSWIDVVTADEVNSSHTPLAELVVVVNPYTRGAVDSVVGNYTFKVLDGTGEYQTDPYVMGVTISGETYNRDWFDGLTDDEKEEQRRKAFQTYIEDLHEGQTFTWNTVNAMSGINHTFFRVERVMTNGTIKEEFYSLHNDNVGFDNEEDVAPESDWTSNALEISTAYETGEEGSKIYVDLDNTLGQEEVTVYVEGDGITSFEAMAKIAEVLALKYPAATIGNFYSPAEVDGYSVDVVDNGITVTYDFNSDDSVMKDAVVCSIVDVNPKNNTLIGGESTLALGATAGELAGETITAGWVVDVLAAEVTRVFEDTAAAGNAVSGTVYYTGLYQFAEQAVAKVTSAPRGDNFTFEVEAKNDSMFDYDDNGYYASPELLVTLTLEDSETTYAEGATFALSGVEDLDSDIKNLDDLKNLDSVSGDSDDATLELTSKEADTAFIEANEYTLECEMSGKTAGAVAVTYAADGGTTAPIWLTIGGKNQLLDLTNAGDLSRILQSEKDAEGTYWGGANYRTLLKAAPNAVAAVAGATTNSLEDEIGNVRIGRTNTGNAWDAYSWGNMFGSSDWDASELHGAEFVNVFGVITAELQLKNGAVGDSLELLTEGTMCSTRADWDATQDSSTGGADRQHFEMGETIEFSIDLADLEGKNELTINGDNWDNGNLVLNSSAFRVDGNYNITVEDLIGKINVSTCSATLDSAGITASTPGTLVFSLTVGDTVTDGTNGLAVTLS